MAHYTFGSDKTQTKTFQEFVDVVKGRSIVRINEIERGGLELGLSGGVTLRVQFTAQAIEVKISSKESNQEGGDKLAAVPLLLGEMPEAVPGSQFAKKLSGLNQCYSILYLLENRVPVSREWPGFYPLAPVKDELYIESVSPGSWITVVSSKARKALAPLVALATVVFPRTRDAFLRKLEAEAELKEIEAQRGFLALKRESFELAKARTDYVLELVNRVSEREAQDNVRSQLRHAIYDLAAGDPDEDKIRKAARQMLPGGPERWP